MFSKAELEFILDGLLADQARERNARRGEEAFTEEGLERLKKLIAHLELEIAKMHDE